MITYYSLDEIPKIEDTVVALGNFDGVHKGHQELIRRTVNSAYGANRKSAVFTFRNHPRNVLGQQPPVRNILYSDDKEQILRELGVDYLISVEFDKTIQNMTPEEFVRDILIRRLNMKEAYCGFNYRFGHQGSGTPEVLMKIGLNDGFGIHVLEPYKVRGQVVSSTLIRDFIEQGQIDRCLAFMGRYYCLKGIVIPGNRIGRTMGFPTSNVSLDEEMVAPANGVYISYCSYESVRFPSVTNVGHRPTVVKPGMGKNMETHIFNFDTDIYGKQIRVHFLERIRDEMRFPNIDELIAQIRQDCLTAASYHGIINRP